jgi:carboxyl-terminal processing protease
LSGAEKGFKENQLAIIAPLPGTPAERAGLQAGDTILQIDAQDTDGWSIDQAIKKIRGPKGSTVVFVIRRNQDEPKEISVVRDTIVVSTVTAKMLTVDQHQVGYIKISSFTEDTVAKVRQEIQGQLAKSAEGFVIDLRNNPGGLLDASVDIASIFVSDQVIVSEVDQSGRRQDLRSTGGRLVDAQPVTVLVNGGSASASEIVAGALQDLGRATIIGQQTFGKGSVQQLDDLPDGSTLKLTIAKWYTPKNRSISEQGITPDIVVEPGTDSAADPQLDRATNELIRLLQ